MSVTLNVYRCHDGHYLLMAGALRDSMQGAELMWIGMLDADAIPDILRARVERELRMREFALLTSAQFYNTSHTTH